MRYRGLHCARCLSCRCSQCPSISHGTGTRPGSRAGGALKGNVEDAAPHRIQVGMLFNSAHWLQDGNEVSLTELYEADAEQVMLDSFPISCQVLGGTCTISAYHLCRFATNVQLKSKFGPATRQGIVNPRTQNHTRTIYYTTCTIAHECTTLCGVF
jgi:hypothetical protein